MNTFQPAIKWSGSKRSQAQNIVSFFPREIETYYEPFCGGCSVLRAMFETDIKVKHYVCSDTNITLISLWQLIKSNPKLVSTQYKKLWTQLNSLEDVEQQKEFYEKIRDKFNKEKNPFDFMFLNRTCFNGLIRYNKKGEFNSPFHLNRGGIKPDTFEKIIKEWSKLINQHNVEFKMMTYQWVKPSADDFMYLDPPYAKTKGMYWQEFDNVRFFRWLKNVPCAWALSYDGKSGEEDNTYDVPTEIYDEHYYLSSGNSSFKRITETDNNAKVFESLYLKNL
jgi:DNA adenine methylase